MYLAVKDGMSTTIPDTQKERYENMGYTCTLYVPVSETTKKSSK